MTSPLVAPFEVSVTAHTFPQIKTMTPSELSFVSKDVQEHDTPFGLAWWQVIPEKALRRTAALFAASLRCDSSAPICIESELRFRTDQRVIAERTPCVFNQRELSNSIDESPESIVSGVVLVIACQIVMSKDSYATYCDMFGNAPIISRTNGVVVPPASESVANLRAAGKSLSTAKVLPPLHQSAINALPAATRERRQFMIDALGAEGGEYGFKRVGSDYQTTFDTLRRKKKSLARSAPMASLVRSTVLGNSSNVNDDDDSFEPLVAPREPPAAAVALALPAQPPPSITDEKRDWLCKMLATGRWRLNLIVRGYLERALARTAPTFQTHVMSQFFYVLSPHDICATVAQATMRAAAQLSPTASRFVPSVVSLTTTQQRMPPGRELLFAETSNMSIDIPPASSPPAIIYHRGVAMLEPQPVWRRHLFDRLDEIDLGKLTFYEVDRATRHRATLLLIVNDFYTTDADELDNSDYVRTYPGGYGAPVAQHYLGAPGLLGNCTPLHYSAVGLAMMCVIVRMHPELTEWFAQAETWYLSVRKLDADIDAHGERIDTQISACVVPRAGSTLATLLERIVVDIKARIKTPASNAPADSDDLDDADAQTAYTAPPDDSASIGGTDSIDEPFGDGDIVNA